MTSYELNRTVLEIANTRGSNAKIALLAQVPELQRLVKTAYSPYVHFNIKVTEAMMSKCGHEFFGPTTNALLKALASGVLSGAAAKRAVVAEMERLEPGSQGLLAKVINKDLRWGMQATSINKAFPGLIPVFPVQLAKPYEENRLAFPCLISPKIDGLRCVYLDGVLRTRYGNKLIGLDHIADYIRDTWPSVRRLDGELTVEGKLFDELSGNLRSFKKSDDAIYHVFDVFGADEGLPQYRRLALLTGLFQLQQPKFLTPVEHLTITSEQQAFECYSQYRELGFEGAILKNPDALEVAGRTWDWCKLKPKDTADCLVKDVEVGSGKYSNAVGRLVVDFRGKECRVGGGLSDSQRENWWMDPNLIVGKTVEVEYMEITPSGALRHPRLKVVRGDK